MSSMFTDPVGTLADLFAQQGSADYFAGGDQRDFLGEPVTQAAHMLQAAALAEAAGATPALVAAALLHDVGHFTGPISGDELMRGTDNHHSDSGADWLARWFPPAVTEPVRLHVAAKRFLCATEPDYHDALSDASKYTLSVQGGPMSAVEVAEFALSRYARDAVALRRWDEAAKEPDAAVPDFDHYHVLLRSLLLS